jgi:serine/threonine protein phosphatase PrpC
VTDSAVPDQTVGCPHCGADNPSGSHYCHKCGRALPSTKAAEVEVRIHHIAARTDIGKRHHVNQDAGGVWTWRRSDGVPASLVIVADGVSAGDRSEVASRLAVDTMYRHMAPLVEQAEASLDELQAVLLESGREANHLISQRPHETLSRADASTLVAAVCVGGEGRGIWLEDSRAYLVTSRFVSRLTRDHSWAEGVVQHGMMSEEEATRDPRAHMITRWLGPPDEDDPGLEAFGYRLSVGDTLLCCSDGLYMYFAPPVSEPQEFGRILAAHGSDLQGALEEMVALALERGGHDNITAAAIRAASH